MTRHSIVGNCALKLGLDAAPELLGNSPVGSNGMSRQTNFLTFRAHRSTVPGGCPAQRTRAGHLSGCHFRCFVTCSKVRGFQKHFGHDRNSDFRKRALEEGSQAVPEPLRELSGRVPSDAAGHGTLCPSSCGTVSRGLRLATRAGHSSGGHFECFGNIV